MDGESFLDFSLLELLWPLVGSLLTGDDGSAESFAA